MLMYEDCCVGYPVCRTCLKRLNGMGSRRSIPGVVVQFATEHPVVKRYGCSCGSVTMLFWSRLVIHTFKCMLRACRSAIIAAGLRNPLGGAAECVCRQRP